MSRRGGQAQGAIGEEERGGRRRHSCQRAAADRVPTYTGSVLPPDAVGGALIRVEARGLEGSSPTERVWKQGHKVILALGSETSWPLFSTGPKHPTPTPPTHHPSPGRACTRWSLPSGRTGRAGMACRPRPARCQRWGWRCQRGCGEGRRAHGGCVWHSRRRSAAAALSSAPSSWPCTQAAASPLVARKRLGGRAPGAGGARSADAGAALIHLGVLAGDAGLGRGLHGRAGRRRGRRDRRQLRWCAHGSALPPRRRPTRPQAQCRVRRRCSHRMRLSST